MPIQALGPTQPPIQRTLWHLTADVKRTACADLHLEFKHDWRQKSSSRVCVRDLYLDNLAFTFYMLSCFWNAVSAAESALSRILMASDDDDDDQDGWVFFKIWKVAY
jgi:hypothetical protein